MASINLCSDIGDEDCILCPTCGNPYTHHIGVQSITRFCEDNPKGTNVTIRGHQVSFSNDAKTHNASSRRDSIIMRFYCEYGCDDFLVSIIQHKGITFIRSDVIDGSGCSGYYDEDKET